MSKLMGFVCLVAVIVSMNSTAQAYQVATSGVEVVAAPAGPSGWTLSIETDTTIGDGGFNVVGASTSLEINPPCDSNNVFCISVPSSNGLNVFLVAFTPVLTPNVGNPLAIANVDNVIDLDYTDVLNNFGAIGFHDFNTFAPIPTTLVVVPEPGTGLLLALSLASLSLVRRRSL